MADINLAWFSRDFLTQGADIRMIVGYDSKSTDFQSSDQGSLPAAIAERWTLPLRSDGSPALVGVCGSAASSLVHLATSTLTANGWTQTTGRTPGTAFTDATNQNCGAPACENTVATGAARTAWGGAGSTTGVVHQWLFGGVHSVRTGSPYADVYGGDPFSNRQTHARVIIKGTATTPTDMLLKGVRQLQSSATVSTNNTAYVSTPTINASGTTVQAFDADCGAGYGLAGYHLTNPAAPSGATPLQLYLLGSRVFRSSSNLPIAGWHIGSWGTGGHNITQFASCLGLTGYTTPDPYFSATDAQAFAAAMVGGGATAGPTHWLIYTGNNYTATEQTELAAGTVTAYLANHIAVINRCVAISRALNGATTMPKVCLVFTEVQQNSYTATHWRTALQAVQMAAAQTGQSCMDLFSRTNTLALTGSPYTSFSNPFSKASTINSQAGSGSGPVVNSSLDNLHHSRGGDRLIATMMWDAMVASCGYVPQLSVYGANMGYKKTPTRARSYGVR